MIKLKTHITEDKRQFTSKAGNPLVTTVFVFLPNPLTLKKGFDVPPAGVYDGVYKIYRRYYTKFSLAESK